MSERIRRHPALAVWDQSFRGQRIEDGRRGDPAVRFVADPGHEHFHPLDQLGTFIVGGNMDKDLAFPRRGHDSGTVAFGTPGSIERIRRPNASINAERSELGTHVVYVGGDARKEIITELVSDVDQSLETVRLVSRGATVEVLPEGVGGEGRWALGNDPWSG
jgi:hypothetical protein